jgi:hypothetical protein
MEKSHLLPNNPARQWYRYTSVPIEAAITITSMQLQTSKLPEYLTSTPPSNPQAQLLYTKCTRLNTNL